MHSTGKASQEDVKKLEIEFPEDEEIAKFANDLNSLLADTIGLRNEDLSLNEYQEKALELKGNENKRSSDDRHAYGKMQRA